MPINGSATFSLGPDQTSLTGLLLQPRRVDNTSTGPPISTGIINEGDGIFSYYGPVPNDAVSAKLYSTADSTVISFRDLLITSGSGIVAPPETAGIQPLFVYDKPTLKSYLRLSGAAAPDALAMIDNAILAARMRFYDAIGVTRVQQIAAITYTDNPTNDDQVLRLKANQAETAIVRQFLLRTMPVLFVDGSAIAREVFNDEPLSRFSKSDTEAEINRLDDEIGSLMADLALNEEPAPSLNINTIGPAAPPPRPGDSVRTPYPFSYGPYGCRDGGIF